MEEKPIYELVNEKFTCDHEEMRVRYRVARNGVKQYRRQCMTCGTVTNALAYASLTDEEKLYAEEVDDSISEQWHAARMDYWQSLNELEQSERAREIQAKQQEWWNWYNAYLNSPAWQSRRTAVFRRDDFMCQSCLQREAEQVHHTTYAHVGNEPLFDLVSVCGYCHEIITEMERDREATRHDDKRQLINVSMTPAPLYLNGNGRNGQ